MHPTFIFDLQALTYHYIWPETLRPTFLFHLTFKLCLAFIFDLQDLTYLYIWPLSSDQRLYFIWPARSAYIYIWPASSDLPSYLTCQLWPTFILDLPALTYFYTWPVSSDLPLYLICQLWPTFILDLQAEVCTALRVGHRDPIKPAALCVLTLDTMTKHVDLNTTALCGPQTPSSLMPSGSVWGLPVAFADDPRNVKVTSVGVGKAVTSKRTNTGSAWKVTSPTSSSPRGEPVLQTCSVRFVTAKKRKGKGYKTSPTSWPPGGEPAFQT